MINILNYLVFTVVGFWIGIIFTNWSKDLKQKNERLKEKVNINNQFKQILEKVNTKRSRFKNRINNTVFIGVKLEDFGRVDVVVFIDKNDISIFKNDKCIMTSELVESEILDEVIQSIYKVHYRKINDVIEFLGLTFSRTDFEKSFGISFEDLKLKAEGMSLNNDESDIQKIIDKNHKKLDIDDILDKINQVGINNLTLEEKEFLKNYNKND